MKMIEFKMEMFDLAVRRLANGNKLKLVLESAEDLELEKELIDFRGENVKLVISTEEGDEFHGVFEVFDRKCRSLRNGDKLRLVLEKSYEKSAEIEFVKLRYNDVNIQMVLINTDLPGINGDDGVMEDDDE